MSGIKFPNDEQTLEIKVPLWRIEDTMFFTSVNVDQTVGCHNRPCFQIANITERPTKTKQNHLSVRKRVNVSNDNELMQSEPLSRPQSQSGK